jgi:hypothetical protein
MAQVVSTGTRLACPACTTEVVVVRAAESSGLLACRGEELVGTDDPRSFEGHSHSDGQGVLLGKRYVDGESDLELLCIKSGPGLLTSDGRELTIQGAKPLPSSD